MKEDLHRLVLIRGASQLDLYSVRKFNHNLPLGPNFYPQDLGIHDVEKSWLRPATFFPMSQVIALLKKIDRGCHNKPDRAKSELEIKLADTHLSSELADDRRQV